MKRILKDAIRFAQSDPQLAEFDITAQGKELHLSKNGDSFARLLPAAKEKQWRMEYFHQRERWKHIEFSGTLEECLAFLAENTHYLFWEG
jgi:hypothetical protein